MARFMGDSSVLFSFGDLEQCAAMKAEAIRCGLRAPPQPWIWIKSNKNATFKPVMCYPGAVYVYLLVVGLG